MMELLQILAISILLKKVIPVMIHVNVKLDCIAFEVLEKSVILSQDMLEARELTR